MTVTREADTYRSYELLLFCITDTTIARTSMMMLTLTRTTVCGFQLSSGSRILQTTQRYSSVRTPDEGSTSKWSWKTSFSEIKPTTLNNFSEERQSKFVLQLVALALLLSGWDASFLRGFPTLASNLHVGYLCIN